MQVWNLLHVALWKHRTQKSHQKLPSGHHRTTLSGYIFATKAHIDNQNKLVKQQYLLHVSPQYGVLGPLAAEIGLPVWGTPANFDSFRVLAALLHGSEVVSVSQTLRRWTEGATYVWQGGHLVGHWPTFLVLYNYLIFHCAEWSVVCDIDICFRFGLLTCKNKCVFCVAYL